MHKNQKYVYYPEYLKLDQLLNSQERLSEKYGRPAHDEMLFIIVHQVYELWFKQILFELDKGIEILDQNKIEEYRLNQITKAINRINTIFSLLIDQIKVMETMSPADFLDFRDYLIPASGFQSIQFRMVEIKLGISETLRQKFEGQSFLGRLTKEDQKRLEGLFSKPTLFNLTEKWLERMPFLENSEFAFMKEYEKAVTRMQESDKKIIENNPVLDQDAKDGQLKQWNANKRMFEGLFDEQKYQKLGRRLSFKATQAALMIQLYREEPILHFPYQYLTALIELDELMSTWRYAHAMLAQRMLGTKIGTGGSSGHHYLKRTVEKNRIFTDLFDLATFLIPKSELPDLPQSLKKQMGFLWN